MSASPGHPAHPGCPLCEQPGGLLVWESAWMRVIRADEALHPATWRVVWSAHVPEFGELPALQRLACIDALVSVEQVVRECLAPRKVNLAALGNLVPHLHWHVIARWDWDSHWPQAVWAAQQREPDTARLAELAAQLPGVDLRLRERLQQRFGADPAGAAQITRE